MPVRQRYLRRFFALVEIMSERNGRTIKLGCQREIQSRFLARKCLGHRISESDIERKMETHRFTLRPIWPNLANCRSHNHYHHCYLQLSFSSSFLPGLLVIQLANYRAGLRFTIATFCSLNLN